jgi:hypothetical protein
MALAVGNARETRSQPVGWVAVVGTSAVTSAETSAATSAAGFLVGAAQNREVGDGVDGCRVVVTCERATGADEGAVYARFLFGGSELHAN